MFRIHDLLEKDAFGVNLALFSFSSGKKNSCFYEIQRKKILKEKKKVQKKKAFAFKLFKRNDLKKGNNLNDNLQQNNDMYHFLFY